MSTRCHTAITKGNQKAYVYRHHDGYPNGAGEDLKAFMHENKDALATMSVNDFGAELAKFDSEFEFENFGVHGDEEYVYHVNLDEQTLECHKVPIGEDATENFDDFELVFKEEF